MIEFSDFVIVSLKRKTRLSDRLANCFINISSSIHISGSYFYSCGKLVAEEASSGSRVKIFLVSGISRTCTKKNTYQKYRLYISYVVSNYTTFSKYNGDIGVFLV